MTDTFERTQLDGKDRGQLSEIASALGVKAVSRLRKAELVEAIVAATSGAAEKTNGASSARPRKVRSTGSGGDDLASLADEQNALASTSDPVDEMAIIRRRPASSTSPGTTGNGADPVPAPTTPAPPAAFASTTTAPPASAPAPHSDYEAGDDDSPNDHSSNDHGSNDYSPNDNGGGQQQHQQARGEDDGQGNRRRRRRRGRDRDRPVGGGDGFRDHQRE